MSTRSRNTTEGKGPPRKKTRFALAQKGLVYEEMSKHEKNNLKFYAKTVGLLLAPQLPLWIKMTKIVKLAAKSNGVSKEDREHECGCLIQEHNVENASPFGRQEVDWDRFRPFQLRQRGRETLINRTKKVYNEALTYQAKTFARSLKDYDKDDDQDKVDGIPIDWDHPTDGPNQLWLLRARFTSQIRIALYPVSREDCINLALEWGPNLKTKASFHHVIKECWEKRVLSMTMEWCKEGLVGAQPVPHPLKRDVETEFYYLEDEEQQTRAVAHLKSFWQLRSDLKLIPDVELSWRTASVTKPLADLTEQETFAFTRWVCHSYLYAARAKKTSQQKKYLNWETKENSLEHIPVEEGTRLPDEVYSPLTQDFLRHWSNMITKQELSHPPFLPQSNKQKLAKSRNMEDTSKWIYHGEYFDAIFDQQVEQSNLETRELDKRGVQMTVTPIEQYILKKICLHRLIGYAHDEDGIKPHKWMLKLRAMRQKKLKKKQGPSFFEDKWILGQSALGQFDQRIGYFNGKYHWKFPPVEIIGEDDPEKVLEMCVGRTNLFTRVGGFLQEFIYLDESDPYKQMEAAYNSAADFAESLKEQVDDSDAFQVDDESGDIYYVGNDWKVSAQKETVANIMFIVLTYAPCFSLNKQTLWGKVTHTLSMMAETGCYVDGLETLAKNQEDKANAAHPLLKNKEEKDAKKFLYTTPGAGWISKQQKNLQLLSSFLDALHQSPGGCVPPSHPKSVVKRYPDHLDKMMLVLRAMECHKPRAMGGTYRHYAACMKFWMSDYHQLSFLDLIEAFFVVVSYEQPSMARKEEKDAVDAAIAKLSKTGKRAIQKWIKETVKLWKSSKQLKQGYGWGKRAISDDEEQHDEEPMSSEDDEKTQKDAGEGSDDPKEAVEQDSEESSEGEPHQPVEPEQVTQDDDSDLSKDPEPIVQDVPPRKDDGLSKLLAASAQVDMADKAL